MIANEEESRVMITLNDKTIAHLVDHLAPKIAERLADRPRPGDVPPEAVHRPARSGSP